MASGFENSSNQEQLSHAKEVCRKYKQDISFLKEKMLLREEINENSLVALQTVLTAGPFMVFFVSLGCVAICDNIFPVFMMLPNSIIFTGLLISIIEYRWSSINNHLFSAMFSVGSRHQILFFGPVVGILFSMATSDWHFGLWLGFWIFSSLGDQETLDLNNKTQIFGITAGIYHILIVSAFSFKLRRFAFLLIALFGSCSDARGRKRFFDICVRIVLKGINI